MSANCKAGRRYSPSKPQTVPANGMGSASQEKRTVGGRLVLGTRQKREVRPEWSYSDDCGVGCRSDGRFMAAGCAVLSDATTSMHCLTICAADPGDRCRHEARADLFRYYRAIALSVWRTKEMVSRE